VRKRKCDYDDGHTGAIGETSGFTETLVGDGAMDMCCRDDSEAKEGDTQTAAVIPY
jgi:hypothetical protein